MWLFLIWACDEMRTPCAEIEGDDVIFFGQCPEKEPEEISSVNVFAGDLTVMWAAGTEVRGEALESIVYGELPAGWTSSIGPEPLSSGETYGADIAYFDAPKASLDFVAP